MIHRITDVIGMVKRWRIWRLPRLFRAVGLRETIGLLGLRRIITSSLTVGLVLTIGAVYWIASQHGFNWQAIFDDYVDSLPTLMLGIGIAVLISDGLIKQNRKRAIIQQMGSTYHEVALEGVRLAALEHWLVDGSLRGVDLRSADLRQANLYLSIVQGARLRDSHLEGASLYQANLQDSDLRNTWMQGSLLTGTELQQADLRDANLREAIFLQTNLLNANLIGAKFTDARFDENTILPDGTKWSPDTDLSRFTNPKHPDFWSPPGNDPG